MPDYRKPVDITIMKASGAIKAAVAYLAGMAENATVLRHALKLIARIRRTLVGPIMRRREFASGAPPVAAEYNDLMREASIDLNVLASTSNLHKTAIVHDYNFAKTENLFLNSMTKTIEDKLRDVLVYRKVRTADIIARDSFANMAKVDIKMTTARPLADLNASQQLITLSATGQDERQQNAQVSIVQGPRLIEDTLGLLGNESNGFPGNTHEIMVNTNAVGNAPSAELEQFVFVGADNAHVDLSDLVDGNPNTWFEYELANVPESEKERVGGFGFAYDAVIEGEVKQINWARDPDGGTLRLHLKVVLEDQCSINWIGVRLHVPPNAGATPCKIVDIRTAPDDLAIERSIFAAAQRATSTTGDETFTFQPHVAKIIHLYFQQPDHFPILVGHVYYKRIIQTETHTTYLFGLIDGGTTTETTETRIDGPNVPIEVVGAVPSVNAGQVLGGLAFNVGGLVYGLASMGVLAAAAGPVGLGIAVIGIVLMGLKQQHSSTNEEVKSGIESLDGGWRYAIGISDVVIKSARYAVESEIISVQYITPTPIRMLYLEADDWVPEDFPNAVDMEWISYYVSVDDGGTWHEISPRNRAFGRAPEIYHVNPNDLIITADPRVGRISTDTEATSARVRIVLRRPAGDRYIMMTPLVREYALFLTTD